MLRWITVFSIGLLAACTHFPSAPERTAQASQLAQQLGWRPRNIETDFFTLRTYQPAAPSKTGSLTVYLEGDGFAWVTPSKPSSNPTPVDPIGLKLAMRDSGAAVYLARPCQYVETPQRKNCIPRYWTSGRFAEEVVAATNQAIDTLVQNYGAGELILVGHSGGGAVAALVAARRDDVHRLITIAGNLDHRAWSREHRLTPLAESLNPADSWQALTHMPQTHYVGGRDDNIGISVVRSYQSRFKNGTEPEVVIVPGFDHHCCWETAWPRLKE